MELKSKFYKKRYVFSDKDIKNSFEYLLHSQYFVSRLNQVDIFKNDNIKEYVPKAIIQKEMDYNIFFAVCCFRRDNYSLAGIGFFILPKKIRIWYDNMLIDIKEARFIGDYVLPEHRGRGIGSCINAERIVWAKQDLRAKKVSVIVESYRLPAIKAQQKYLSLTGTNYLIKLWGRNIFSICKGSPHKGIWYVGPGRQRRWHIEKA